MRKDDAVTTKDEVAIVFSRHSRAVRATHLGDRAPLSSGRRAGALLPPRRQSAPALRQGLRGARSQRWRFARSAQGRRHRMLTGGGVRNVNFRQHP
jgi:hypothetical protein